MGESRKLDSQGSMTECLTLSCILMYKQCSLLGDGHQDLHTARRVAAPEADYIVHWVLLYITMTFARI